MSHSHPSFTPVSARCLASLAKQNETAWVDKQKRERDDFDRPDLWQVQFGALANSRKFSPTRMANIYLKKSHLFCAASGSVCPLFFSATVAGMKRAPWMLHRWHLEGSVATFWTSQKRKKKRIHSSRNASISFLPGSGFSTQKPQ